MPDCCIGVDVIVGFPGETKEHFLETYNYLNELDISYLHVFTYSERANTLAANMPSKVSNTEKAERSKMLHILSDKKRRSFYESQLGKTFPVLWENDVQNNRMEGFTSNYVRVATAYDPLQINEVSYFTLNHIGDDMVVTGTELAVLA
jgi:threonylcarbamoyladenosine tRNA methylthiotransferase MtaB